MKNLIPARNTVYFKAINDDYRANGVYLRLDLGAFRVIVVLQSNCNQYGVVSKLNGKGYDISEIASITETNFKTTKRALKTLVENKLITIDENKVITIIDFMEKQSICSSPSKQIIAAKKQNNQSTKSVIEGLTRTVNETNGTLKDLKSKIRYIPSTTNNDEVIDTKTGETFKITKVKTQ